MNVAIIVWSETGKTMLLAEMARDELTAAGHQVVLTRLQTTATFDAKHNLPEKDIKFSNLPDISNADRVVIGGPVWAFRPCATVKKAVSELGAQLKGKTVLIFVTHAFPWAWLTGTSSANTLRRMAADQGAKILPGVVLSGSQKKDQSKYPTAAEKICALLG